MGMAAGRLCRHVKISQALTLENAYMRIEARGLNALESGKGSFRTLFQGAIFKSYFLSARGEASTSSHEKTKSLHWGATGIKSPTPAAAADTECLRLLQHVDKYADISRSKYSPPLWMKPLSQDLQYFKVRQILSPANSRTQSLYLGHIDQHRRSLQNSSRRNNKNGEKPPFLEAGAGVKYSVIRIDSDGKLQDLELKSLELGVHPRDVDLLSSGTFVPQRATIAVQRDKVLVRMENVRAIVRKDHVLLFDARHPRISTEGILASAVPSMENSHPRASHAFAQSLAQQVKEVPSCPLDPMPFHLRVMESLLEETSNFFHQKVDRLKLVVERMLQELTQDVSMGGLRRLLPLRRAVTEVEHDVRDAHEAMDQILRSDEILQTLCLIDEGGPTSLDPQLANPKLQGPQIPEEKDERMSRLRQAAADMLITYQREVDDAGGFLEELRKAMEASQEVWELGLDATRNRIIRMNLYISICTFSVGVGTLPAAFFGMNLPSGFEEHPTLFYWVVGWASVLPVGICIGFVLVVKLWPRIVDKRRAQDLAGLLDLLRHLDSIDDIIGSVVSEGKAGKVVTPKKFREIVRSHPSTKCMRQRELDILYRMLDRNSNGILEVKETKISSSHSSTPLSDIGDTR